MSGNLSKISALHFVKLILRSVLFVSVLVFYILDRTDVLTYNAILPAVVWVFFIVMLPSFFLMATRSSFKRRPSSDGLFAIGSGFEQLPIRAATTGHNMTPRIAIPTMIFVFLFISVSFKILLRKYGTGANSMCVRKEMRPVI